MPIKMYRASFQNSGEILETTSFKYLFDCVKLSLTSDHSRKGKPEMVFFQHYGVGVHEGLFYALERRIFNIGGAAHCAIILHTGYGEYILRDIKE